MDPAALICSTIDSASLCTKKKRGFQNFETRNHSSGQDKSDHDNFSTTQQEGQHNEEEKYHPRNNDCTGYNENNEDEEEQENDYTELSFDSPSLQPGGDPTTTTKAVAVIPADHCWEVEEISIPIATSLHDDTLIQFNIMSSIGKWSHGNEGRKLYLPSWYNQNTDDFRRQHIAPLFKKPCQRAGFQISMGWEKAEYKIIFRCVHNLKFQTKSINGSSCGCLFRFLVYWDRVHSRWFLKEFGPGHGWHRGHVRLEAGDEEDEEADDNDDTIGLNDLARQVQQHPLDPMEEQRVHEMLCRGEAYAHLRPLVEDVAKLLETPQHYVELRNLLLQYKEKHLRRHRLVETDLTEKNGNLKPRKKRKLCQLCKTTTQVKTKTSKLCKVCRIPICTNPECLDLHREHILISRR